MYIRSHDIRVLYTASMGCDCWKSQRGKNWIDSIRGKLKVFIKFEAATDDADKSTPVAPAAAAKAMHYVYCAIAAATGAARCCRWCLYFSRLAPRGVIGGVAMVFVFSIGLFICTVLYIDGAVGCVQDNVEWSPLIDFAMLPRDAIGEF